MKFVCFCTFTLLLFYVYTTFSCLYFILVMLIYRLTVIDLELVCNKNKEYFYLFFREVIFIIFFFELLIGRKHVR